MKVRYGSISARCTACASQHFELVSPSAPLTAQSVLACLHCGETHIHGHLTSQIGDEACRQAHEASLDLQARRRRHRVRLAALRAA